MNRLPEVWDVRIRSTLTLADSEPEPNLAVVKADEQIYRTRHPGPGDVDLVIEVADSTLPGDRADKGRIYARAGLAVYWIVNLVDQQIEVYENPTGSTAKPEYAKQTIFSPEDSVPLVLHGKKVMMLAAKDLLP